MKEISKLQIYILWYGGTAKIVQCFLTLRGKVWSDNFKFRKGNEIEKLGKGKIQAKYKQNTERFTEYKRKAI